MVLPQLPMEEKILALQKAQEMRTKRLIIRKKLKAGELSLQEALNRNDDAIKKMRVSYLLESLPGVGKITAKEVMEDIGIVQSRRVQGLGRRQKEMLLEKFQVC